MLYLAVLCSVLLAAAGFSIRRIFLQYVRTAAEAVVFKKQGLARLQADHERLQLEIGLLSKEIQDTVTVYEATRNMCKFLDEEKIFAVFKETTQKYIHLADCRYFPQDETAALPDDYQKIALETEAGSSAYVAVKGLDRQDHDKFYSMIHQLVLALRRASLYRKIQALAVVDSLTGAFTRRHCLERYQEEVARSGKFGLVFSVLLADIDFFKSYNDRYGHLVGDVILKEVVRIIRDNLRTIDIVGRFGGEEFFIILPETSKENSMVVAERIRSKIEKASVKAYDETINMTISIGVAAFPEDSRDQQELIDKADWALYRCKNTGRNRVCAFKVYK